MNIEKAIENILFVWGDPLNIKDISETLEISNKECEKILKKMIDDFSINRGLNILKMGDFYQLSTDEKYYDIIAKLVGKNKNNKLSNAALETVSIIAYKQPITRGEIEEIRGVKSDKVIDSLLDKNLIYDAGRLDKPGKPIIYKTTEFFLKLLSITSIEELPSIDIVEKEEKS